MTTDAPAPTPASAQPTSFPRPGSSLYYALGSAPAAKRPVLHQWLRWWHEVSTIPFTVSDPGVAETKLRWWQQEVHDASQGQAHHPLIKQWPGAHGGMPLLPDWPLWQQHLEALLQLVQQTRWLDDASRLRHAERSTGTVCEAAAQLLGANSTEARQAARQIGQGLHLAHQLARLGQDARIGWVHVAIDVLQTHQVRAHELSRPAAEAPATWPALMRHQHDQARQTLKAALTALGRLPPTQARAMKPLVVLAHIQLAQMVAIEAAGGQVLHQRIVLTPLRKWWISQQVRWGLLW